MQDRLEIRRAAPDDWQGILPLFEQLYHGDIGPDLRNVFTTLVTHRENCILVAEKNRKLVGTLVGTFHLDMDWEGKIAKLQAIIVDKPHRRHGIGRILYQQFLSYAKRHHARAITARVNRRNREAIVFYEKLAFAKTETIEYTLDITQNPNA